MFWLYALHSDDGIIRYIGMTNDCEKRYEQHIKYTIGNSKKVCWIRLCIKQGKPVTMKRLQSFDSRIECERAERDEIEKNQPEFNVKHGFSFWKAKNTPVTA
jgi:predicted GIY-YIG superfamily endonuclease